MLPNLATDDEVVDCEVMTSSTPDMDIEMSDLTRMSDGLVGFN